MPLSVFIGLAFYVASVFGIVLYMIFSFDPNELWKDREEDE